MSNCEFCKSDAFEKIGKAFFLKKKSDVLKCKKCGSTVKDQDSHLKELNEYYQNIQHDDAILFINKTKDQLNFLKKNIDFTKVKNILEIGPGPSGLLLKFDSNRYACEIDQKSIEVLEKNGVVNFKSLDQIRNKKFDLIILSHVFEHIIEELDNYLLDLFKLLSNDGYIFIEVPSSEYELMIYNNELINHNFTDAHKRSCSENGFKLIFERLNIINYKVATFVHNFRKKEYYHRYIYSKIIHLFCKDKNARKNFTLMLPKFMYHFFISIIFSFIIKKKKISPASIRVLIRH